jgi:tyrosinase
LQQILTSYAQELVASYPPDVRPTYQIAADNLRLAYWDWAAIPQLPAIVEQPTIAITTGNGTQNVTNPFYQYKFQKFPLDPTYFPTSRVGDSFLAEDPATMRGVTSQGGSSNPDLVNQYLANSNLMRQTVCCILVGERNGADSE